MTTSQSDEAPRPNSRDRARERLRSGQLPREPPIRRLAGLSDGTEQCAVCDERIVNLLVYRVSFDDGRTLHFHARCHEAWLIERRASTDAGP